MKAGLVRLLHNTGVDMRKIAIAVLFRLYLGVRSWLVFTKNWWMTDNPGVEETKYDDLKDLQELAQLKQSRPRKIRRL